LDYAGIVRVLEIPESARILKWCFQGLKSAWILDKELKLLEIKLHFTV